MNIIRVFPHRTNATPTDRFAFVGDPPLMLPEEVGDGWEVHVSCTFTWDKPRAEELAESWERFGLPVGLSGPAYGIASGEFVPGRYLREGYTITSRGCPNKCWFCVVPRREGGLRELPIRDGWNILDDNLLACSEEHVRAVFNMLSRQPYPADFSGGLEAVRLKPWHCELLTTIRVAQVWCAYDTPDDLEHLYRAGRMLADIDITVANRKARAYVLIGYPSDTQDRADKRLRKTLDAGFLPHAMLWRDDAGNVPAVEWQRFQRLWARPALIAARCLSVSDSEEQRGLFDD